MFCPARASNRFEIMKKTIAILALATVGITTVTAGVRFGINFGIPIPPPVVVAPAPVVVAPPIPAPIVEVTPVCPVPGFIWVGGSWGWCNNHWVWTRGHWGPPAHWNHYAHWHHGYSAGHHEGFHGERGRR
jgi:hypothetical protein